MAQVVINRDEAGRITQLVLRTPPAERNGPTALLGLLALGSGALGWQGHTGGDARMAVLGGGAALAFALLLLARLLRRGAAVPEERLVADAAGLHPRAPGSAPLPWPSLAGFTQDLQPVGLEPRMALLAQPADGSPPQPLADSTEAELPELEAALEAFRAQQAGAA